MSLTIRPLTEEDTGAVIAFWQAAGTDLTDSDPAADIAFCLSTSNAEILLGFEDGLLAATIMIRHDGQRGWYHHVSIMPGKYRDRLARSIMEAAEAWLAARGISHAQLMLRPGDEAMHAFCKHHGYSEEPGVVLAKRLPPASGDDITIQVICLEMRQPPERPAARFPETGRKIALSRIGVPGIRFHRYLYNNVGRDWYWIARRFMDDERLARMLARPGAEYHLLTVEGEPAGYCEMERRSTETELCHFGLLPDFIGTGLGRYMIDAVVDRAWLPGVERVWLRTCDLDHPRALGNYMAAGFRPFARETEPLPDPRRVGLPLPPAPDARGHSPDSLFRNPAALSRLPDITPART